MKISPIKYNNFLKPQDNEHRKEIQAKFEPVNLPMFFYTPNFCAAQNLTLPFILKKRSHLLPERVLAKVKEICENPPEVMPSIKDIHFSVYANLFKCKTLEKAKELYPEFKNVLNAKILKNNKSQSIKTIKEKMNIEDFSLAFLKDLYSFINEDAIVEKYGFSGRFTIFWLMDKLNIVKPKGNYHMLIKLIDESANARYAELAKKTLHNKPDIESRRVEGIRKATRTEEYKQKRRAQQNEYLKNNPQISENTRLISQETWNRCPEIKDALTEYTRNQPLKIKKILEKRRMGRILTDKQKKGLKSYYKGFWNSHSELKKIYSETRKQVTQEMKENGLLK